jgi:sensor histidine kinase YesM
MRRVYRFITSFFDVKHGIKAKIFLSFSSLTLVITVIISLYWYARIRQSVIDAIADNMAKMVNAGLAQIENSYYDIQLMHFMVIYESNCSDYFFRTLPSAPTLEWFSSYYRLYSSLKTMGTTMSRTVSGMGVFKNDGATCLQGVLTLPYLFSETEEARLVGNGDGNDVMFFLDKNSVFDGGTDGFSGIKKYIFIGRTVLDKGRHKAFLVSKINETIFTDAFHEASYPQGFTLLLDRNRDIVYDSSPGVSGEDKEYFRKQPVSCGFITNKNYTVFSKTAPSMGITAVVSISNEYIHQSYRALQGQLVLIIFAAVLTEALLSMFISNRITQRLRNLEYSMEKFGEGIMPQSLPIDGGDEVGGLSRTYRRMIDQIRKLMDDMKENERQKRQLEIRALRSQIGPHFLYNSLNTIGYLAMMQNVKNIHDYVTALISLLQTAVKVDDTLVPFPEEIGYAKSYLALQIYRFSRNIQTDFRLDDFTGGCLVPKMILQPIVENALIHGLRDSQEDPRITIKAYPLGSNLVISVTDNGLGMTGRKIREVLRKDGKSGDVRGEPRFSGIGLSNVHSRIRLQFGEPYGISIYSREKLFTTVEIRLPVIKAEKDGAAPEDSP